MAYEWEHDRGLSGRRERFEHELANLNKICSLVVVEATLGTCLVEMPSWGVKSSELNAKIFNRTVLSYQQRFPHVAWMFADTTRMAEVYTFRWLYRWWRKNLKKKRKKSIFGKGFDPRSDWIWTRRGKAREGGARLGTAGQARQGGAGLGKAGMELNRNTRESHGCQRTEVSCQGSME